MQYNLLLKTMEENLFRALEKCALFEGMSPASIRSALENVTYRVVNFCKNDVYAVAGSTCRHTDVVLRGEMAVRMSGLSGRQVEVARLRQGDVISSCFLYSSGNCIPATIEAVGHVSILRMSKEGLMNLIDSNHEVRWNFIRIVSDLGAYLAGKIRFLSLMTVREKLLYLLNKEVNTQGSKTIVLRESRQRIADVFAIQKFSLLRCLADLVKQGIISVQGRVITVLDMKRI